MAVEPERRRSALVHRPRAAWLKFDLAFESRLVLQAIVAGEPRDDLGAHPIVHNAADILARDAGHGGKVALAHFLADDDAALTDVLAESVREIDECTRDAALERQETSRRHDLVGVAQPRGQNFGER